MENDKQIPTYRILDGAGNTLEGASIPDEVRVQRTDKLCICILIEALPFSQIDEPHARRMSVTPDSDY